MEYYVKSLSVEKVVLTFTPIIETEAVEFTDASAKEVMTAGSEILDKHIAAFKALAYLP